MNQMIAVSARPHALRNDVVQRFVAEGPTLLDMIRDIQPDPAAHHTMRVWINGHFIEPRYYHVIRPKDGTQVVIKAWVGKQALGTLLSIMLTIVAPWAGAAFATSLGLTGTALTIGSNLIAAGITLLGSMAINSLVAPPSATSAGEQAVALPGLQGSRNIMRPGGAIPVILGKHHIAPDLAAEPYTINVGSDVYLRQLFVVGYGPLKITDIKIGETPIEQFTDYRIQVREGYPSDGPTTLYPNVATQDGFSIAVLKDTYSVRTSPSDADELFIDLEWPRGLRVYGSDGKKYGRWQRIEVRYREVGTVPWTNAPFLDVFGDRLETIRRTVRIDVPRGQYEVGVRRVTSPQQPRPEDPLLIPADRVIQDLFWTAIRTIRDEQPIEFPRDLAVIALDIKATEQLNGVVDQLNCVASSVVRDWTGSAWVERETANVGSIYRHLLQGPQAKRAVADSRLDLPSIQYLAERTRALGLEVNAVLTEQESLFDILRRVLAIGRASFTMKDGKYSASIDEPKTTPVQMFTPRNIMSASFERIYTDMPDALRVRFRSRAAGYSEDEVIVYNDGFTRATARKFEVLQLWGVTSETQAYRAGRYHFAAAKLRPEVVEISTDIEGNICRPGDLVRMANDAMLVGLASGRIISMATDIGGDVTGITLDTECPMVGGKSYGVVIRKHTGTLELVQGVVTDVGAPQALTFTAPIPAVNAPDLDDLVAFGEVGKIVSDWTVRGMARQNDLSCSLTLVPHAPDVHDESGPIPDYNPVITLPISERKPNPPVIVNVQTGTAALERVRGQIEPRVIAAVRIHQGVSEPPIARIEAQWQREGEQEWTRLGVRVDGLSLVQLREVQSLDRINLRIRSISESGRPSNWTVRNNVVVVGITEPPADVQNFRIAANGSQATLSWTAVPGLDISHYEIRWSRETTGVTWTNSTTLVAQATGTSAIVPFRAGTYLIRAYDLDGRNSVTPAQVLTDLDRVSGFNVVETRTEHPGFTGTKTDVVFDAGLGGLRRSGVAPIGSGTYDFATAIDLGSVYTSRVTADLKISTANLIADVFARPDWFGVEDYFGLPSGDTTNVQLQISLSQIAAISGGWGPWQDFEVGDFTARSIRFRAILSNTEDGMTPVLQECSVTVDMPDRVASLIYAVPSGGGTVNFAPAFQARPTVGITIQGGASGDRVSYTATRTGVTVQVFNSAGTGIARTVEIIAKGYGET